MSAGKRVKINGLTDKEVYEEAFEYIRRIGLYRRRTEELVTEIRKKHPGSTDKEIEDKILSSVRKEIKPNIRVAGRDHFIRIYGCFSD